MSNIVDNEEIKSSVKNLEDSMIDYLDYEDEDEENDGYTPSYNHDDVKTAMNYIHEFLEKIEKAIQEHNPDIILSVGQAGGRFDITVERVGINMDDFRIPDNEGNQVIDEPIFSDGDNAYFVKLPVKAMVQNIQKNKIPASVSYTAGTFVCNHVLYGVLYLVEKKYKGKKSGFIHIPFLPEQVVDKRNMPSMELNTIVTGLTAAIEAIVENAEDIKETGGTVC